MIDLKIYYFQKVREAEYHYRLYDTIKNANLFFCP